MVKQYPHTITVDITPGFEPDEKGNLQETGQSGTFSSDCRAEPAGSNPVIKGADGEDLVYSWIVYMPKTDVKLSFGDTVTITVENGQQHSASLKRQHNGQLNTRLWV